MALSKNELTPREQEILALVIAGMSSRAAAAKLDVSPRTIEFHRANIMHKLGEKNVADLMRIVLADNRTQPPVATYEPVIQFPVFISKLGPKSG